MTWEALNTPATVVGGFATGLALFALVIGLVQILESRRMMREADAQQTYNEYLRMCVEYPHLSSSAVAFKHLDITSWPDVVSVISKDSEQYLWFVSYMLNACEKILLSVGADPAWSSAMRAQISYHSDLLAVAWDRRDDRTGDQIGWNAHYSDQMKLLVKRVLSDA